LIHLLTYLLTNLSQPTVAVQHDHLVIITKVAAWQLRTRTTC